MKDESLNVPATLDIAPRKITEHKSHPQSSVFCLNQIKLHIQLEMTFCMVNPGGFRFKAQIKMS